MPKRGEHIHKRKDGRWEGRYKNGINENGKTKYSSVYAKSYTEVKKKLLDCMHSQSVCQKNASGSIAFGEALASWRKVNEIRYKGSTVMKYNNLIEKHILPKLGNMKLRDISTDVLSAFMKQKLENGRKDGEGGLSPSYVRSIMLLVTQVLQFAAAEELCSPVKSSFSKPPVVKKEIDVLSQDSQDKLESYISQHNDKTGLGIMLSLYAGLRIGEVCALAWNDVDFNSCTIHVRSTVSRVNNMKSVNHPATILIVDKPKTVSSLRDIPMSSVIYPYLLEMSKSGTSP